MSQDIVAKLAVVLEQRKTADPKESYAASLYSKGLDHILKKLDEECEETIHAARVETRSALIHEVADLWFHSLVLLAVKDINPDEVFAELEHRAGLSGLAEKASRK